MSILIWIVWIVLGLGVGWLAASRMRTRYGWRIDIGLGVIGALIGGFLASSLFQGDPAFVSGVVAVMGALLLLALARVLSWNPLRRSADSEVT